MKVLGLAGGPYDRSYVCTVSHIELAKYLGIYHVSSDKKLKELDVGQEIDLGKGHDHAREIASALAQTKSFIEAHKSVVKAILDGLSIERKAAAATHEDLL